MADLFDRSKQRELMWKLASAYPEAVFGRELPPVWLDKDAFRFNIAYLEEHKLVDAGLEIYGEGDVRVQWCRITAKGLDLLAGDGGLSAI